MKMGMLPEGFLLQVPCCVFDGRLEFKHELFSVEAVWQGGEELHYHFPGVL